jgi:hypothetical protein
MRTFKSPKRRLEPKQLPMLHHYTVKHPDGRLFRCEVTSPALTKETCPWATQRLKDWEITVGSYHLKPAEHDMVVEWMETTGGPADRLKINPWGGFALVPQTGAKSDS